MLSKAYKKLLSCSITTEAEFLKNLTKRLIKMDFVDEVKALAAKIPGLLEHIKTEAATRTALVEPFIRALGYDTSDPTEVVHESVPT